MVEKQKGRKVMFLRSDNGGENTSTELKEYLASKGIEHELSILEHSEKNRVVELMNQTFTERVRSMRLQANMSEGFWAEAMSHACYLVNMSLSTAVDLQIPEEISRGESMDIQPYGFLVTRRII